MKVIYYGLAAIAISFGANANCTLTTTQNSIYLGEHNIGTLSQQSTLLHSAPLQYRLTCDEPVQLQGFTLRENRNLAEGSGATDASSYLSLTVDELRNGDGEPLSFSLAPGQPRQRHLPNYRLSVDREALHILVPDNEVGQHFTLSLTVSSFAASATQLRQQQRDNIPLSTQLLVSANYLDPDVR
ncbi:hypothetical protein ACUTRI_13260 [Serratia sp. TSA_130.2]|jgi:hypothetical protein|uniref:Fimbrial protein n=1 Tax=Serratia marcescens TaxID=615 RepID=A0AA46QB54_SERMA|nr:MULTISPECIES: hypothetical protein [Serratia]ASL94236.1 hypothetical protein BVG94_16945 [Serratia marcescens]AYU91895.1 hypothetical protein EDY99_16705 [Serratia sp. LS-1]KKO55685.1 putative lipoprotein [Serratia ureilytica]MBH1903665.1 hypothetical protein [Serratia ureilytica]MBH2641224.1 hypothetical protein [Serratia ureilytica]